jgi:tetratricopeptide (TPR) repeat protein
MVTSPSGSERDRIFISYRRDDARGASGRVWDWLRIGFGKDRLFRDVADIGAGKWRRKIDQALAASTACVVVVGRRWADTTNLPRLQDPNDVVRHELETALACGDRDQLTVIPLLVEDAQLAEIPAAQLPASLQPLLRDWNVLSLTESGWDDDTRRLIAAIAAATGLPLNPELEEWLDLIGGARQGLAMVRGEAAAEAAARQGEAQALHGLLHRAADADAEERPSLKAALAAMAAGNTLLAEASFEQELEDSRRQRQAAEQRAQAERRRESEAACQIAGLALVRGDLAKAIRYYQLAVDANPGDLDAALELGYAWISRGDLAAARAALEPLIAQARVLDQRRQQGRAWLALAEVLRLQGEGGAALAASQQALQIATDLVKADPTNIQQRRDQAIALIRSADLDALQGDGEGALAGYQQSQAILEHLLQKDRTSLQWRRDLSVCQEKISSLLLSRDEGDQALAAAQACLALRVELVGLEPTNTQAQRDLSVSQEKIGAVLFARGDMSGALDAFQASLVIRQALAERDPANSQWQRDLSVSQEKVGAVLGSQQQWEQALSFYQDSLRQRQMLLQRDPSNREWQRDCFVSQIKIGELLQAAGDGSGSEVAYEAALAIALELTQRDPAATTWQRDLYVGHLKLADLHAAQANPARAEGEYEQAAMIAEALLRRDPSNRQRQMDVVIVCARLGSLAGRLPFARLEQVLDRGRELVQRLSASGPWADGQAWLEWFDQALAQLPAPDPGQGRNPRNAS